MNKHKFKLLFLLLLVVLIGYRVDAMEDVSYTNPDSGYRLVIEDDANLLSDSEIEELKDDMMSLTEYGNIAFKSIDVNYTGTASYALNYYHNNFGTESGTLFLIDMDNRYIYIFSDGANYNIITTAKANIITDNVYKYASDGDYYKCASVAFSQMETILSGGKIAEPMRYISNFLIAITLAFFINFIIVLVNSSIKKAKDKEILANCVINFNIGAMHADKVGTHREYSPVESSSGGGSSGGGGGGGSSGGGGGHSF